MNALIIFALTIPAFFLGYGISYIVMTFGIKQDKE